MNEIDGYISKENSYKVTVKDKIEYTKVDVKDEIKSAAEVAPAEDAEVDNVEVEAVIQDTVETVDSTCTPSKVGAGDVDTSNFPKASVGGSTKVDIAQAAVTASAKRVGYHATGNGIIWCDYIIRDIIGNSNTKIIRNNSTKIIGNDNTE